MTRNNVCKWPSSGPGTGWGLDQFVECESAGADILQSARAQPHTLTHTQLHMPRTDTSVLKAKRRE